MQQITVLANASDVASGLLVFVALPICLFLLWFMRKMAKLTRINYSAAEKLSEEQAGVELQEYIDRNGGALVRQLLKSEGDRHQIPGGGGETLLLDGGDFDDADIEIEQQPLPNQEALGGEFAAMEALISMEEDLEERGDD